MSADRIETVLGRAISEPEFADLLLSDPDNALAGYDLTAEELESLRSMTRVDFETLAQASPEERKSFSVISNLTKFKHDAVKNTIRNLKG